MTGRSPCFPAHGERRIAFAAAVNTTSAIGRSREFDTEMPAVTTPAMTGTARVGPGSMDRRESHRGSSTASHYSFGKGFPRGGSLECWTYVPKPRLPRSAQRRMGLGKIPTPPIARWFDQVGSLEALNEEILRSRK